MQFHSSAILERFRVNFGRDIDLTLRPCYRELLAKLGNPHTKLPPVVHVAGTNGKGSTCAFLRAMVEAAGYKVHVYTSPHLVTFHERIRVAGSLIAEDELADILGMCESLVEKGTISYFEAATAAAFVAFTRHPADLTILEVGLGGRLDATNVIDKPAATVITRLSFDHRDYLGNSLTQIAREKAGIMREGVPCFIAPQPMSEARAALEQAAHTIKAPLFIGGDDWHVESKDAEHFRFTDAKRTLDLPTPALIGQHQLGNAGLAIATAAALPMHIPDTAIQKAMQTVEWPARMQKLAGGALSTLLATGWELWLDGGHNDSAGEVIAAQLNAWRKQDSRPIHIILGMLSTKIPQEFVMPMVPFIDAIRVMTIPDEPLSFSADVLENLVKETGITNIATAPTLQNAIHSLMQTSASGRILICGSLHFAGHVLKEENGDDRFK